MTSSWGFGVAQFGATGVARAAIARRTSRSSPMRALRRTSSRQPRSRGGRVTVLDLGAGRCRATSRSSTSSGGWAPRSSRRPPRSPSGAAPLAGVDADLSDLSDTAPTLAVVAPFASSSTRGHAASGSSARKETDRIAGGRQRAAPVRRRRGRATGRLRRASRGATRSDDRDVRRPPHGDELRAARPA